MNGADRIDGRRWAGYLLDLDGTLVDSAPDITRALNHILELHELPPVSDARARDWIGDGSRMLITRALAAHGREPDDIEALFERFIDFYAADTGRLDALYPGTIEFLDALDGAGLPYACVTNKPGHLTDQVLEAHGIRHRFGAIFSGDSLPTRKPAPEPLLAACVELDVRIGAVLMVGDSLVDLQAAANAGCDFCLIRHGYWRRQDGDPPADTLAIDHWSALQPRA